MINFNVIKRTTSESRAIISGKTVDMPLTVHDVRQIRSEKAHVNHTTYKQIYGLIEMAIKRRAARGDTSTEFVVPPFVPGRPMYTLDHAIRYCKEKLQYNGFVVTLKDDVLLIDWKTPPSSAGKRVPLPQPTQPTQPTQSKKQVPTYTLQTNKVPKSKVSSTLSSLRQKLGLS